MVGNSMLVQRECFLPQSSPRVGWTLRIQSLARHWSLSQAGWAAPWGDTATVTPPLPWLQESSSKRPNVPISIVAGPSACSDVSVFNLVLPLNKFGELPGSLPNGPPCTVNVRLTHVSAQGGRPGRESWGLPGFGPRLNRLLCACWSYQTSCALLSSWFMP